MSQLDSGQIVVGKVDEQNSETAPERVVVKAKRRFEINQDDNLKGKFQLKASLGNSEPTLKNQSFVFAPKNDCVESIKIRTQPVIRPNPLSSADALKQVKELDSKNKEEKQSPIMKSLFDFKGNSKFKNEQPRLSFNNFQNTDQNARRGIPVVFKPYEHCDQPIPAPVFKQGSSLFDLISQPPKTTEVSNTSPVQYEADNEGKCELQSKSEVVASNDKKFQCQIKKIKILKGIGTQNPQPSKKDAGYLSIETTNGVNLIVYRSLSGMVMFQGVVSKLNGKIKILDDKHKVKFIVAVKADSGMKSEHCEVTLYNRNDKESFFKIFSDLI